MTKTLVFILLVINHVIFLFAGLSFDLNAQLVINEVQASNNITISDEDGSFEDWIEINNSGTVPVSLKGFGLTDNDNPFKWIFPDTTIQPGEFFVIWASGKNRITAGKPLHTNFSISAQGETLVLSNLNGSVLDHVNTGPLPADVSFGRSPGDSLNWYFFENPTPGKINLQPGLTGISDIPVFSYPGGFYDKELDLVISSPNSTVHYTIDCSDPTPGDPVFDQPIHVSDKSNSDPYYSKIRLNPVKAEEWGMPWRAPDGSLYRATVIRAKAFKDGFIPSETVTQTYFVDVENRKTFTLPAISLVSDSMNLFGNEKGICIAGKIFDDNGWGPGIWGAPNANYWQGGDAWERSASIELFESPGGRTLAQNVGIRIHGGASRINPDKAFRVEADSKYGKSRIDLSFSTDKPKQEYKSIIFRNSGQDFHKQTTMFRDAMTQNLFSHLNFDTQGYIPSVIFINGEYWGITNIRERYDRFFISMKYGVDPENIDFLSGDRQVREGTTDHINEMINYMANNDITETAVYNKIGEMLDINNFIDYNIANIYINNTDWPGNNREFWRLRTEYVPGKPSGQDGRWRYMLYDTDFGFGLTYSNTDPAENNTLNMATKGGGNSWPNPYWSTFELKTLLRNDAFRNKFINSFMDYLNTFLKPEYVIDHISTFAKRIEPEIDYHIYRWGYPESLQQWQKNVEEMQQFAEKRHYYQKRHIRDAFGLADPVQLRIDVDDENGGYVQVNSISINESTKGILTPVYPWEGSYFPGIPITISAHPAKGYSFHGWKEYPGKEATITLTPDAGKSEIQLTALFNPASGIDVTGSDEKAINLEAIFPNPFSYQTSISFKILAAGNVIFDLYSIDGVFIKNAYNSFLQPGSHQITFISDGFNSGVYFFQLTFISDDQSQKISRRGKLVIIK